MHIHQKKLDDSLRGGKPAHRRVYTSEEDLKCNEEELTKTKAVRSEKLALNQQPTAQLGGGGAKTAISMGGKPTYALR
uniref:Uncharacterized protein n=1 Tax=Haemonchus contortus TaxID=6289 RepID=A0A7I4YYW5_HAECO